MDPELFEACAADLLSELYPTLTPLRGGSDRGRDGIIAPHGQVPFPLITTTAKDAKANLRRNLAEVLKSEQKPFQAVFATSRRITPQARDTLEHEALSLGISPLTIFDHDWFTNALYRHEGWSQRLLNVSGRPSALSILPLSARPIANNALIGRQRELDATRSASGDLLIVGPPGSGKTFLLRELALEGNALFLIDPDRLALANAIRSQRPSAIILDDAHISHGQILNLKQLRNEVGAPFRIIAVSWPADAQHVQSQLGVPSNAVIELPDLDLDTLVDIVKSVGLIGPNYLIRAIVHQSTGRPGLAATLADLCLRGDARDVWSGLSLAKDLLPALSKLAGHDVKPLLGCLALGGGSGMSIDVVSAYLGESLHFLSRALARIGSAGVIRQDAANRKVSVWPEAFRWLLAKEVFFSDAYAMDPAPLVNHSSNYDIAHTFIGAHSRGAKIDRLVEYVERANSTEIWGAYASLGRKESLHVLEFYPHISKQLYKVLLTECPDGILPVMLNAAIEDKRELHATPEHPLRIIRDWIRSPAESGDARLKRTQVLLETTESWWRAADLSDASVGNVAIQATCFAFASDWEEFTSDPGSGRTITITHGAYDSHTLRGLHKLWKAYRRLLLIGAHDAWRDALTLAQDWRHGPMNVRLPKPLSTLRRKVCTEILSDISKASPNRLGVQNRIREICGRFKCRVKTIPNREFDILFPIRENASRWREDYARFERDAKSLSSSWLAQGPEKCAVKIVQFEREATSVGITWPRLSRSLFSEIAQNADPCSWIEELVRAEAPAELVEIFLRRIVETGENATALLRKCLDIPNYAHASAWVILSSKTTALELLQLALQKTAAFPEILEAWFSRGDPQPKALDLALNSEHSSVAIAAAIGEWCSASHDKRSVRAPAQWRRAILKTARVDHLSLRNAEDHWLVDILKSDPTIAHDWLLEFLARNDESYGFMAYRVGKKALRTLNEEQRLALLSHFNERAGAYILISALVGNGVMVYRSLLARSDLKSFHLLPLAGTPSADWREKAISALNAGYSTEQVLRETRLREWSWSGNISDMWKEQKRAFDDFVDDEDSRIAAIAAAGSQYMTERVEEALAREREEAVRGRSRTRR